MPIVVMLCFTVFIVTLSLVMLGLVKLSLIMLSLIMLNVVMLSVVAPIFAQLSINVRSIQDQDPTLKLFAVNY